METLKQKYIDLIRKTPLMLGATIILNNSEKVELVDTKRGIEVKNEHNAQFHLEQLELNEILSFCYELNIEPRMDYLIMTNNNQWLSTGKFATQPEIDTEIENILSNYDENRPELVIFTADSMQTFNV